MTDKKVPVISEVRRISMLAEKHPDKTAIIFVPKVGDERHISWRELDRFSNQLARLLAKHGVNDKSIVASGFQNRPETVFVAYAAWKLGACFMPMRATSPVAERNEILAVANVTVVAADWEDVAFPLLKTEDLKKAQEFSDAPLPDCIACPRAAVTSGGSTGRPKIIVRQTQAVYNPDALNHWSSVTGQRMGQVQLAGGALYHSFPTIATFNGLMLDQTVIIMEAFNADRAVDLIERHRVNFMFMVPTMMQRISRVPDIETRDLSSIEAIVHAGAACPAWAKQAWIDLIGAENVYEIFGGSEAVGMLYIRGDEWLKHRGSLGRATGCEMQIRDEQGNVLPQGMVGEVYMRTKATGPSYQYLNSAPAKTTSDGLTSIGDMGYVDEEGYLYYADRRVDMIVTGGANVFAAEVEHALSEHPKVADVAVIGLPDTDWGKRVHAIVQPEDPNAPPATQELDEFCRQKLSSYKIPKTYEFIEKLPRDAAGKIRRVALVEGRISAGT